MLNKYVEETDYSELNFEAVTKNGEQAKEVYCDHWEQARAGIEIAQLLCKKSLLKWILGLAIIIGDKIQERICD